MSRLSKSSEKENSFHLFSLRSIFTNIDGKLLWLDEYFDNGQITHMSGVLKFDHEHEYIFH